MAHKQKHKESHSGALIIICKARCKRFSSFVKYNHFLFHYLQSISEVSKSEDFERIIVIITLTFLEKLHYFLKFPVHLVTFYAFLLFQSLAGELCEVS